MEIAQKIEAGFQQLSHGDGDTQTVYYSAGRNENGALAYPSDSSLAHPSCRFFSWSMKVDWSWWAADQAVFQSKAIDSYGNRFTLDGNALGGTHSTALVARNAVASLAAADGEIPSGRYRYYDGMRYLMGLLHCIGQFKIWPPK